jgi:hypothetical protein
MKYKLTILLWLLTSGLAFSQEQDQKPIRNAVYLELGGNATFYSLNYDRNILIQDRHHLGARLGVSYFGGDSSMTSLPLSFNYLYGPKRDFLEVGFGPTFAFFSPQNLRVAAFFGTLGYRHQDFTKAAWLWRITFNPFIAEYSSDKGYLNWVWMPFGGISIGYSF